MTPATFIALLPALLGLAASGAVSEDPDRQSAARSELILRIPVRPSPALMPIEWVERKGPKCIPSEAIQGALLSAPNHVDFLLAGRSRIRADLAEDCPGLDFYGGFYLTPEDGEICAGRDTIRSRVGGSCRVERFHRLVPQARR